MKRLIEDKRVELVSKGKRGKREKGDGKTRYEKRVKSRFASSTRSYNQIDMNEFFKEDILTVGIEVRGETDDYVVTMKFNGVLELLKNRLKQQGNVMDLRAMIRALLDAFNKENVYIGCSCPDYYYRFSYVNTQDKINAGPPQLIPAPITNPHNDLGTGCKHIMLTLANTGWLIKVASVLVNYIKYMETHRQKDYADIIYPAIYGKKYEEPVQLSIEDKDELDTDKETIDKSNEEGRTRGQFKPGNKLGRKFTSSKLNPDQINIDEIE